MPVIRIDYLEAHKGVIPTLARWHFEQWGRIHPSMSIEDKCRWLEQRCGRWQIPTAFIAFMDDKPSGFACLVEHDLETEMDLSPWLASVLVATELRGRGIGSALSERVVEEARALRFSSVYLFTPDKEQFYERLGWRIFDYDEHKRFGRIAIMVRHLAT